MKKIFIIALLIAWQNCVHAEIIFEGFYKISQFKKHIGFYILRHDLDVAKKEFKTTTYLRLVGNNLDMTETLETKSNLDFSPISYSYMATDGKKSKSIDAQIKNGKMNGFALDNGVKKNISVVLTKPMPFFSSSLYFALLKSKQGLRTGSDFDFKAIAEENASIESGKAKFDSKMISKGTQQLLRAEISFAGPDYENLITEKGETFSAYTPSTGIESELVKSADDATKNIKFSSTSIEKIFGQFPEGKKNFLNITN